MFAFNIKAKLTTIIVLSLMAPITWSQDASMVPEPVQQVTVVVRRGDTLWGYSRKYGCTVAEIKAANNLKRDSVVLGEQIKIPTSAPSVAPDSSETVAGDAPVDLLSGTAPSAPTPLVTENAPIMVHTVKAGETLRSICEDYGVSASEFIKVNKIGAGYRLVVGAKLKIPGRTTPSKPISDHTDAGSDVRTAVTQTTNISADGTDLLETDHGAIAQPTPSSITAKDTSTSSTSNQTKPPSDLDSWINDVPGQEPPPTQNVLPVENGTGGDSTSDNVLKPDTQNTNTSETGSHTDSAISSPGSEQTPPEPVPVPLVSPDETSTGSDTTAPANTDGDSGSKIKPVEPLVPDTSTAVSPPSELLVPDTSTPANDTSANKPAVITPDGSKPEVLVPDDQQTEPTSVAPSVPDAGGATVLVPDAEGSASENSTVVTSDDGSSTNSYSSNVGGVANLLDSTPVVTDVPMPTVKKNQPLVTNVFMDSDIKQVLSDIASVAHVVIISDDSVKPQNISIEFNKEPLDTALEKVALSGGLVWKERSDGVYLVSSGTPDSPLFREFAMTKRYMPSNMSAETLGDLLSSSWKNYYKVDKVGNMITITAPPQVSEKIERDLKMIDSPLRQIVVDAVIIEMTADTGMDTGFSWNFGKGGVDSDQNIVYAKATELDFVKLKALLASGNAKMKANPRVSCFEGRETTLTVGKETFYSILTGNSIYGSSQIQKIATGITLKVTVYIGTDGYVTMKLDPEVGDFTTPVGGNPTVTIRRANTTMRVKSGETLVIGGLVQELESKNSTKVPVLGDLPFIGELFKSNKTSKSRTDVVMLITPHLSEKGAGDVAETLRKLDASALKQ
ncbi:MAG: LysM peptidoglycan-binding domain-containing protein [Armatimonadota bacterium]